LGNQGVTAVEVVTPAVISGDWPRDATHAAARTNPDVETRYVKRIVPGAAPGTDGVSGSVGGGTGVGSMLLGATRSPRVDVRGGGASDGLGGRPSLGGATKFGATVACLLGGDATVVVTDDVGVGPTSA
jgi:hypothetical protein